MGNAARMKKRYLFILFCGFALASETSDAEIIKNLEFYESFEILKDYEVVEDESAKDLESEDSHD